MEAVIFAMVAAWWIQGAAGQARTEFNAAWAGAQKRSRTARIAAGGSQNLRDGVRGVWRGGKAGVATGRRIAKERATKREAARLERGERDVDIAVEKPEPGPTFWERAEERAQVWLDEREVKKAVKRDLKTQAAPKQDDNPEWLIGPQPVETSTDPTPETTDVDDWRIQDGHLVHNDVQPAEAVELAVPENDPPRESNWDDPGGIDRRDDDRTDATGGGHDHAPSTVDYDDADLDRMRQGKCATRTVTGYCPNPRMDSYAYCEAHLEFLADGKPISSIAPYQYCETCGELEGFTEDGMTDTTTDPAGGLGTTTGGQVPTDRFGIPYKDSGESLLTSVPDSILRDAGLTRHESLTNYATKGGVLYRLDVSAGGEVRAVRAPDDNGHTGLGGPRRNGITAEEAASFAAGMVIPDSGPISGGTTEDGLTTNTTTDPATGPDTTTGGEDMTQHRTGYEPVAGSPGLALGPGGHVYYVTKRDGGSDYGYVPRDSAESMGRPPESWIGNGGTGNGTGANTRGGTTMSAPTVTAAEVFNVQSGRDSLTGVQEAGAQYTDIASSAKTQADSIVTRCEQALGFFGNQDMDPARLNEIAAVMDQAMQMQSDADALQSSSEALNASAAAALAGLENERGMEEQVQSGHRMRETASYAAS